MTPKTDIPPVQAGVPATQTGMPAAPAGLLKLVQDASWTLSPARLAERLTPGYTRYRHIKFIDDVISTAILKGGARLVLSMPPRHGKSWYCSKSLPAWYLSVYPDRHVILASYEATFAATWGRQVRNFVQDHAGTLQVNLQQDSMASDRWTTTQGGGMFTTGIGGPITGRGAQLIVIDDPCKNWEEARSEIMRQSQIDWFTSTLYTRCEPGASIVVLMCMTGDTGVLLGDGTEKPLRDIRPGEVIATYADGRLTTSVVKTWKNQGPDDVYQVTTNSGIVIKANARHPFLVCRNEGLEWIRLKHLLPGDQLMQAVSEKDTGKGKPAKLPTVTDPSVAKGSVSDIISKNDNTKESSHLPQTQKPGALLGCGTGTESNLLTTTVCCQTKVEDVGSVDVCLKKTGSSTGAGTSASIMTILPERSEAFFVTTATSLSDGEKPPNSCAAPLTTYVVIPDEIIEIVPIGREDVFDIEVAVTENFIANGIVSHNTRWHDQDLAGYLLSDHQDDWTEIRLPAFAEDDDVLGRNPGEPLCPERFDAAALTQIKASLGPNMFASLYQQRPTELDGDIFKARMFDRLVFTPETYTSMEYTWITVDTAYSDKTQNDFTVACAWGMSGGQLCLIDVFRQRIRAADVEVPLTQFITRNSTVRFRGAYIEPKGHGMYLNQVLPRKGIPLPTEDQIKDFYADRKSDKVIRANNAVPYLSNKKVYINSAIQGIDDLIAEAVGFPRTKHDDFVDTLVDALKYAQMHLNSGLSICDVL